MKFFKNLLLLLSCVAISHTVHVVAAPILGYPVGHTNSGGLLGPSEDLACYEAKPLVSKRGNRYAQYPPYGEPSPPPPHRSCKKAWSDWWKKIVVLWKEFWSDFTTGDRMPEAPNRAKGYSRNYPLPGTPMSEVDPRISPLWVPDGPEK